MKAALLILIALIVVYAMVQGIIFFRHVSIGKSLAKDSKPFSYAQESPAARILIVGDSTAVGTGVTDPNDSIAGLFHKDFPQAEIVNKSENGVRLSQITSQLLQTQGKFDFVLVQGGGNDIVHFTPLSKASQDMDRVVKKAQEYSDIVIVITSGNIGLAPIFPFPVNKIYEYSSKKYLEKFKKIIVGNNALFVPLYQEKGDDIFSTDLKKFYAEDGLHLTAEGYKIWYREISKVMRTVTVEF